MSLSIENLSLRLHNANGVISLLSDVSTQLPRGQFVAVIGPSGCGKTTFIKTIAGIAEGHDEGKIIWQGRNLFTHDFLPGEIGYVPQFSVVQDELTVRESIDYAAQLRVSGISENDRFKLIKGILNEVGLSELKNNRVYTLSGGQRRRLALAMELVSAPPILLCDEVTSGLDPQAEGEIIQLLARLAHEGGRLVLLVTHSMKQMDSFDHVVVLYRGFLAYSASPSYLNDYFNVEQAEHLFSQLERLEAPEWHASWKQSAPGYLNTEDSCENESDDEDRCKGSNKTETQGPAPSGFTSQLVTLLNRRFKIFFRSRSQIMLQSGLIIGFPLLVSIFGWNGLPAIQSMGMGEDISMISQLLEANKFLIQSTKIGSLVSGIAMFQVILLSLMGANNSGREIAGERTLLEKEKLAGLNTGSYMISKVVFLGIFCLIQSMWMGLFVHFTCTYPGSLGLQLLFLFLVDASLTSICLGISSLMGSVEQASLASIYLVGFQLPLSGAVLALPAWIGMPVRPFIAAYWSWSGVMQSLRGTPYYNIVSMVVQTGLTKTSICTIILIMQIVLGITFAYYGCRRFRLSSS